MSSEPPRYGRRTLPLDYSFVCVISHGLPHRLSRAARPGLADSSRTVAGGMRMHAARAAHEFLVRVNDDPEFMLAHLRVRAVAPRRPAGVGRASCVMHARRRSGQTRVVRMERKAARSRRRHRRRSELTSRSAIHVCNTTRCDSVCSHSLVPVFDASDPLKRLPGPYSTGDRAHGAYRHARSAPCIAVQGCTGPQMIAGQIARPHIRPNVSKLKLKRRQTARAIGSRPRRRRCGNEMRSRRTPHLHDADDPLTIARSRPPMLERSDALVEPARLASKEST
ncbi:hypothetical protein BLA24064_04593 [Burkholderia latens]|uniref:Uncharacterized protein n=1 Tax=Burkholderia latens TaxID=488446 RepID=A0A6P2NP17_9BURK|nr:hypothetical protein BLA24064_04593 [Burkholderia latens]